MTIRSYITCCDCGTQYKVRYTLGAGYPQTSIFECEICNNKITYGYKSADDNDIIIIGAKLAKDDMDLQSDKSIKTINLVQDFLIDERFLRTDSHFTVVETLVDVMRAGKHELLTYELHNIHLFFNEWDHIKVPLRVLCNKGKNNFEKISKIEYNTFCAIFMDWTSKYFSNFMDVEYTGFINAIKELEVEEISKLKNVIKEEDLLKRTYSIINAYLEVYSSFKPVLINQKTNTILDNKVITVDWDRIEKIYGDIFEVYGNALVIPTIINNLKQGRAFNEFENMSWNTYLKSDKSGRCNNFKNNESLSFMADAYNNTLRNGTHHKAASYDSTLHEIELRTGKKGKTIEKLTLTNYLKNCNIIYGHYLMLVNVILLVDLE